MATEGSIPIASSAGDGVAEPLLQALPDEQQRPSKSRATNNGSASRLVKEICDVFGKRGAWSPLMIIGALAFPESLFEMVS